MYFNGILGLRYIHIFQQNPKFKTNSAIKKSYIKDKFCQRWGLRNRTNIRKTIKTNIGHISSRKIDLSSRKKTLARELQRAVGPLVSGTTFFMGSIFSRWGHFRWKGTKISVHSPFKEPQIPHVFIQPESYFPPAI